MNRVHFVGMKPKRSLVRQVESELEKWISLEQSALVPGKAEYDVRVEKEEAFPYYYCAVEVGFGALRLKSREGGKTLQSALSNTLRRLRVVSLPNRVHSGDRIVA